MGWVHLFNEMFGKCDANSDYVYLSDGGHFDNLGIYELIRRRCGFVIASDAGQDATGSCGELAMVLRRVLVDFGVTVHMDVRDLVPDDRTGFSKRSIAVGTIHYPPTNTEASRIGFLFYVKMTMTGDEPMEVLSYRKRHQDFPHRTTADQFFSESQFESFRRLGYFIGQQCFHGDSSLPRHPLSPPKLGPRSTGQLLDYFQAVRARLQTQVPSNWDDLGSAFDMRYAKLRKDLMVNPKLAKLREELENLSNYIDRMEEERFGAEEIAHPFQFRAQAVDELKNARNVERKADEILEEGGWLIEAAILLSDVCFRLNIQEYFSVMSREWGRVLRLWPLTSAWDRNWENFRNEFTSSFQELIDAIRADIHWVDLRALRDGASALPEPEGLSDGSDQ